MLLLSLLITTETADCDRDALVRSPFCRTRKARSASGSPRPGKLHSALACRHASQGGTPPWLEHLILRRLHRRQALDTRLKERPEGGRGPFAGGWDGCCCCCCSICSILPRCFKWPAVVCGKPGWAENFLFAIQVGIYLILPAGVGGRDRYLCRLRCRCRRLR